MIRRETGPPDLAEMAWIGAVSFEERCLGSLLCLSGRKASLTNAFVVDYPTVAIPKRADIQKRAAHRKKICSLSSNLGSRTSLVSIHPYHLSGMRRLLDQVSSSIPALRFHGIVLDVTCLTKAHTIAAAAWLRDNPAIRMWFAYTSPDQYDTPARHSNTKGRWIDVAVAPCVFDPTVYEEEANGVILLGHEGARIELSLNQCEPKEAIVIIARTPSRPRLQVVTRTSNALLVTDVVSGERTGWTMVEVRSSDVEAVQERVRAFVQKSLKQKRRIVLYPFGPKPLVLAAAAEAIRLAGPRVWYSYPIPKFYDVDYSLGIGASRWYRHVAG